MITRCGRMVMGFRIQVTSIMVLFRDGIGDSLITSNGSRVSLHHVLLSRLLVPLSNGLPRSSLS